MVANSAERLVVNWVEALAVPTAEILVVQWVVATAPHLAAKKAAHSVDY
jgi:hypothetical protein